VCISCATLSPAPERRTSRSLANVYRERQALTWAALRTAFEADSLETAKEKWGSLINAFEPRYPKLAELMHRAEEDVLAYKAFPQAHWQQIHSTNPLERLNKEIKRRTSVIGIFPNEAAVTRLVGALMLEQNDEWATTRRYMSLETVRELCNNAVLDAAQIASI
jgi:transposase-like protein